MSKLIHYLYNRPGKASTVFDQWLVIDQPEVKVLLNEQHVGRSITVGNHPILDHHAPAVWFVFPDAWYDVGRFHLRDGTFTGWYTNICTPVEVHGDRWLSTDLFLDCWIWAGGGHEWLDEHEFTNATRDGTLDRATSGRVAHERDLIQEMVERGDWPPSIARDIDLEAAQNLLAAARR